MRDLVSELSKEDYDETMPLGIVRLVFNSKLSGSSITCPCCERKTSVHKRSISRPQVIGLASFYTEFGKEWGTFSAARSLRGTNRDDEESKLRFWKLIERDPNGSTAKGPWRITSTGEAWLRQEIKIPKYAFVYNNAVLGYDGQELGWEEIISKVELETCLLTVK